MLNVIFRRYGVSFGANVRETLSRETGFGRALRQSLSSSFGGGISLRPRILPNRLPELLSSVTGGAGLNLLPMAQTSSLSAGLEPSGVENPEGLRLYDEVSVSRGVVRAGRLDRQSLGPSEREGSERSPAGGPSNRRREESRESELGGRGPSRRQGLSNLESSSNPPNAPRSLARDVRKSLSQGAPRKFHSRGSATLTRIVLPEKFWSGQSEDKKPGASLSTHGTAFREGFFQTVQVLKLDVAESFWFFLPVLDYFDGFRLGMLVRCAVRGFHRTQQTLEEPKNSSSSCSVRSKAKLPMNAVYGG